MNDQLTNTTVNQLRLRDLGDEEAQMMDKDFVGARIWDATYRWAWKRIDRLVMLLTDSPNIRDVIALRS